MMKDRQIIALYLDRSEQAIEKTREKYGRACYSIAYRILRSHEDSEECESETYFKAWNTIPPLIPQSLFAYLGKIIRNLALNRLEYHKAEKRSAGIEFALQELEECLPSSEGIQQQIDAKELGDLISRFLRACSPPARVIFVRRYWYLNSIAEISAMLGISESKTKSSLFRTRAKLKRVLKKEGADL